jgi:tripartite-type tricarboxylate transporter receptor subunit TctC
MRRTWIFGAIIGAATISLALTSSRAQTDFYKGKTVSIVIGAKTGSLAVAAQLVSHHIYKHIPGNPTVIFRQQPGAAHMNATNHIYNVADADGLTILAANPNVAMSQLAKVSQVRFDVRKFEWLGSSGPDGAMFSIRADLPYKTFKEFKDSGKELIVGTTGPGSNAYDMPLLLKEFAGANLRLVKGYAANSDILLAVERKEADAWAALANTIKSGIDRGAVRALVRTRAPVPGFNDLPIDETLTTDRKIADGAARHSAVDRARLCGAAGHAGRPCRHAARGARQDHRGPAIPGRSQEGADRYGVHLGAGRDQRLRRDDEPIATGPRSDEQVSAA